MEERERGKRGILKKKGYKKLCEAKKKEENERWEKEVERTKNEEVWEIINRKWKKRINKGIEMRE